LVASISAVRPSSEPAQQAAGPSRTLSSHGYAAARPPEPQEALVAALSDRGLSDLSRCATAESISSLRLANQLAESILQCSLAEVHVQNYVHAENLSSRERLSLTTRGTDFTAEVPRIPPGSQLASLDTTPVHSAPSSKEQSQPPMSLLPLEPEAVQYQDPVIEDRVEERVDDLVDDRIDEPVDEDPVDEDPMDEDPDPHRQWSEAVLLRLSEEASLPRAASDRDIAFTSQDMAALFGFNLDTEARVRRTSGTGVEVKEGPRIPFVPPAIPKLDLSRVQLDDDDDDDEDFENKVGADAIGILKSEFITQKPSVDIPHLALSGHGCDDTHHPLRRIQKLPPHPALRKKEKLTMYCDDLTLLLLKQRRFQRQQRKVARKPSAVRLPPLQRKAEVDPAGEGGLMDSVVHSHFHYHYHLPGGRMESRG